jgi:integrase
MATDTLGGGPLTRRHACIISYSAAETRRRRRTRSVYDADGDLVFCHPESGGPPDRSKLTRRFKQAIKLAGVREITFHELRHTFGTRMAAAGVPLRTIQHWMGHADAKTTQVYAHYQPSDHEADTVDQAFSAERRAPRTLAPTRGRSRRRAGSGGQGRRKS